jgi:hypothetical protein
MANVKCSNVKCLKLTDFKAENCGAKIRGTSSAAE